MDIILFVYTKIYFSVIFLKNMHFKKEKKKLPPFYSTGASSLKKIYVWQ